MNILERVIARVFFRGSEVSYTLWWFDTFYPVEKSFTGKINKIKEILFPPPNWFARVWLRGKVQFLYTQLPCIQPLIERLGINGRT